MPGVFHPFAPFVGLRYVRARTHKFFVSFITWVSLLGVGLGVAALIVILSVMNGFEGELRDQLLTLSADARVVPAAGAAAPDQAEWDAVAATLRAQRGVSGVAPYVEIVALAVHQPDMLPVLLRGIEIPRNVYLAQLRRGRAVCGNHGNQQRQRIGPGDPELSGDGCADQHPIIATDQVRELAVPQDLADITDAAFAGRVDAAQ